MTNLSERTAQELAKEIVRSLGHGSLALDELQRRAEERDEALGAAECAVECEKASLARAEAAEAECDRLRELLSAHHAVGALDGALVGDECPVCNP